MTEDFRLRVFLTLAQEKSFTKAAAKLGVSQPAVSNNVSELEKELGVKLFERLHGETVLTPEGKVYMRYVEKYMSLSSELGNLFTDLPQSHVRISASEEIYTYIISRALEDFSTIHPQVTFERSLFDDADLKFSLRPASGNLFDVNPDVIARIKVSLSSPATGMGDIYATHETNSYFELICHPTQAFACTKLYRLLCSYLKSL